jgi:hypothetical protein
MDRSRIAESILSCALPPERASAVTGDFLEEAGARGGFWFWSSVVRLLASTVWNDWREAPLELTGLGARGFVRNLVFLLKYALWFALVTLPGFYLFGWTWQMMAGLPGIDLVLTCAAAYSTGRWIGRRAPERKLAACLALAIATVTIWFVFGRVVIAPRWPGEARLIPFTWRDLFINAAVIYGALKSDGRKPAAQS